MILYCRPTLLVDVDVLDVIRASQPLPILSLSVLLLVEAYHRLPLALCEIVRPFCDLFLQNPRKFLSDVGGAELNDLVSELADLDLLCLGASCRVLQEVLKLGSTTAHRAK